MQLLTEEKIKTKALSLFVQNGYTGTSLADIGNEVGIKKQSIYTHFKNKEDLFLIVMNKVIDEEIYLLKKYFKEHAYTSMKEKLYGYVILLKERFLAKAEENIKFLLRMMFIPPAHLKEVVSEKVMTYYHLLEEHIKDVFEQNEMDILISPEKAKLAFLNIFDGLLVELIYVNVESFETRLEASWEIFGLAVFP